MEGKNNKQRYEFNQQRMKSMEQQQRMGEQTIEQNDMALKGQKEKKWVMGAIQKIQGHQGSSPEQKQQAMGELKKKFPQIMQGVEREQQDQRIKDMQETTAQMEQSVASIKGTADIYSGANTQEQIDQVNEGLDADSPFKGKITTLKDLEAFRTDSPALADLQANAAAATKAATADPENKKKSGEAALRMGLVKAEEQRINIQRQLDELAVPALKSEIDARKALAGQRAKGTGSVPSGVSTGEWHATADIVNADKRFDNLDEATKDKLVSQMSIRAKTLQEEYKNAGQTLGFSYALDLLIEDAASHITPEGGDSKGYFSGDYDSYNPNGAAPQEAEDDSIDPNDPLGIRPKR
jgi:hypothetical protein